MFESYGPDYNEVRKIKNRFYNPNVVSILPTNIELVEQIIEEVYPKLGMILGHIGVILCPACVIV